MSTNSPCSNIKYVRGPDKRQIIVAEGGGKLWRMSNVIEKKVFEVEGFGEGLKTRKFAGDLRPLD